MDVEALKARIDAIMRHAWELAALGCDEWGIEIARLPIPEIDGILDITVYATEDPPNVKLWVTGATDDGIEALKSCFEMPGCSWEALAYSWWLIREADRKVLVSIHFPAPEAKAV